MKFSKSASISFGTFYVFLAMVLVSSIAAASLLPFALEKINSGQYETMTLYVEPSEGHYTLFHKVKYTGDESLDFEQYLLNYNSNNLGVDYTYTPDPCVFDSSINGEGTGYYYNSKKGKGSFAVDYALKGQEYKTGFLSKGDVAIFCYALPKDFIESKSFTLDYLSSQDFESLSQEITLPEDFNLEKTIIIS